ncbi:MAG: hypothetical protein NTZ13_02705 [Candidatus Parcubacteria bacterium]|nr:hypothetical protein [Candidatus Parcubacteria bacterium]
MFNKDFDFNESKEALSIKKTIAFLEDKLSEEMAKRRAKLHFGIEHGKIVFEQEILRRHRELKIGSWKYITRANPLVILTSLIIYPVIIPIIILDLSVTIYQHLCFHIYGIPLVKRHDYMVFERTHLAYLNLVQKINCAYCSYGNGVIAYAREIFARTEQYWCPIKHAKRTILGNHERYEDFADYGDIDSFIKKYKEAREHKKDDSLS